MKTINNSRIDPFGSSSHPDNAIAGLSGDDRKGHQRGTRYSVMIEGTRQTISIPNEYSGAFYGKEQVFYGWSSKGEYSLTFEEMRNALK
ncbi:MAG: hypothetical protein LBI02_11585 [Opitutaceae bacterium]|jgi:hypothetical protein|nr:hypothetical protein [Opitutaceae bacterium]